MTNTNDNLEQEAGAVVPAGRMADTKLSAMADRVLWAILTVCIACMFCLLGCYIEERWVIHQCRTTHVIVAGGDIAVCVLDESAK